MSVIVIGWFVVLSWVEVGGGVDAAKIAARIAATPVPAPSSMHFVERERNGDVGGDVVWR